MDVAVRPSRTLFETWWWEVAYAAICGRWVTHSTWKRPASVRSMRPTLSATAPPMPASTSSNISVLPGRSVVASVFNPSMTRDSSPPEAILASGRASSPGFAEK